MGLLNTNLPTNPFGSRVSGCALEGGVTVGSRLVFVVVCSVHLLYNFKNLYPGI